MNTNDPRANFLTAVKNGKIGILRPQTQKATLLSLLPELEEGTIAGYSYLDSTEWLFDGQQLERVVIRFDGPQAAHRAYTLLQLQWLEVLWRRPYAEVLALFQSSARPFRTLTYEDGTLGLHVFQSPSGLLLNFDADETCQRLTLEFEDRFRVLGGIRTLTVHDSSQLLSPAPCA
ncbi:hypothetical protein HNQ07_003166 [Deinococcus metalli]|uniref:Uncharacterized protein n=1 Tax=Deinococcus metalli TaxID=1141878 RepID=A0A7W8KG93_9DEIO|nr:hypothetical protein [Deinococcus metalli]MBB5377667.1 hypothetical protein [Deinococcus metalli]GHF52422.1 hypothetical protein GCM10017781_30950 [Deinococcus metalli]